MTTTESIIPETAPSKNKTAWEQLRTTTLAATRQWLLLIFAGIVLSMVSLPYPIVFALLLILNNSLVEQRLDEQAHKVEEAVAWGMRRGNWQ